MEELKFLSDDSRKVKDLFVCTPLWESIRSLSVHTLTQHMCGRCDRGLLTLFRAKSDKCVGFESQLTSLTSCDLQSVSYWIV